MTKTTVRNQHYVPRRYLLRFTEAGLLGVYDKQKGRTFNANPRTIAAREFLYDVQKTLDPDSPIFQFFEQELNQIESLFYDVSDDLIRNQSLIAAARLILADYIAIQYKRTILLKETLEDISAKTLIHICEQHLIALGHDKNEVRDSIQVNFSKDGAKINHLQAMFGDSRLQSINTLSKHIWLIGRNMTETPLMTSDAPVVLFNQLEPGAYGFQRKGAEIVFPLSPKYVIWLKESSAGHFYSNMDGQIYDLTDIQVARLNELQIANSLRFAFFAKENLPVIKQLLQTHMTSTMQISMSISNDPATGRVGFKPKRVQ